MPDTHRSPSRSFFFQDLRRDRLVFVAAIALVVLLLLSITSPWWAGNPNTQELTQRLKGPSLDDFPRALAGFDQLGRSVVSRTMAGVRSTLAASAGAVVLGGAIGTAAGMVAGYFGGIVDKVINAISDVQLSFPALLVAMMLSKVTSSGPVALMFILGLNAWMLFARMSRTVTMQVASRGYVQACLALGARSPYVLWRHALPPVMNTIVGVATLELARLMLAESALSFLGFGLTPPDVSLGIVLADGRGFIATAWWITTAAGAVLALLVLSVSLIARWMQERSDPTLQRTFAAEPSAGQL